MGSVIKKRRKRMSKKKHRKLLRKTRHQRKYLTCIQGIGNPAIVTVTGVSLLLRCRQDRCVPATRRDESWFVQYNKAAPARCRCGLEKLE